MSLPVYASEITNMSPQEMAALRQRLFEPDGTPEKRAAAVRVVVVPPLPMVMSQPVPAAAPLTRLDLLMAQFRVVSVQPTPQPAIPISAKSVLKEVSAKHGFTVAALQGKSRTAPVVRARQEAMYRLFTECRWMSYPAIGRALGGRDHSTALHAVKAHARLHGLPAPVRGGGGA